MTIQCDHTYIAISDMQSVCARCSDVLTIGDGKCFRCGIDLDSHVGVIPGPTPGACVVIKRSVQK